MQGKKTDSKALWKHSVKKNIDAQSQILANTKDLPSKFSPIRNNLLSNSSNSLLKTKRNHSSSQDEISLNDNHDRSMSKDGHTRQRTSFIQRPLISGNDTSLIAKQREKSQKSLDISREKRVLHKVESNVAKDFDLVRELKLEFIRFKDRILKELKKQQEDIKKAVEEIYQLISSKKNAASDFSRDQLSFSFQRQPIRQAAKLPASINVNSSKIKEISSNLSNTLSIQMSRTKPSIDIQQNGQQSSINRHGYETSLPQIREQMSKFHSIFNQLKIDIGQQGFPSTSQVQ